MKKAQNKKIIAIYAEGNISTGSLFQRLRESFNPRAHDIRMITTRDILERHILDNPDVSVLFMPGVKNESRSYRDLVTDKGWRTISDYIEKGGIYVGLCAGAYLATELFHYHDKQNNIHRTIKPTLKIFEGTARGPIDEYTQVIDWGNEWATHAIARLSFNEAAGYKGEGRACYTLGPCLTLPPEIEQRPDYKIIARYADIPGTPIAIASRHFGQGKAIFCGVVPEVSSRDVPLTVDIPHIKGAQDFARRLHPYEKQRARTWNALVNEIKMK